MHYRSTTINTLCCLDVHHSAVECGVTRETCRYNGILLMLTTGDWCLYEAPLMKLLIACFTLALGK